MTAVAQRRALGVFAGAKIQGAGLLCGIAHWQKVSAFVGTVAKRLAIALPQEHQKYLRPSSTSTGIGAFCGISGVAINFSLFVGPSLERVRKVKKSYENLRSSHHGKNSGMSLDTWHG